MSVTKVGDLVWVRVQGHPWWPGQVMDPKKATNDKVKRDRKPDHTLISFFGDDSYGWFPKGRDIIPFHQNYDSKSRQAASKRDKKFNRACAEGMEVYTRRLGKEPGTKYRPHDFLHPGWSDDSDEEAAEDRYDDLRPLPASAEKLQDCSAQQALLWLHTVACNPMERPKMSPVKIDGAKRQLFSLAKSHNVKLQEATLKRRKSPSPDADPINAETAAAAEAAEAADGAHITKDKEEQQAAATGKKTKALKKEKSMGEEAAQGIGKARLVKRKRKDEAESKSDKDKPKKQRRKPAIAEVREEDSIDEVKEEDSVSPEAAQDAPASNLQPESPQVKSDVENEPLSDSDAEPEPKPEQEKKSRKKKQPPVEDDDKATHPPARVNKGSGSYRGPGPRQLKASFPAIIAVLRDMAVDPNSHVWDGQKAEAAAWLSFRELVFSYSHFNKEGEVGETTAEALSARDVRWAKVKSEKAPVGVPAEPGADLGIEYRYTHYISKLSDSRHAFEEQLAQFYGQHGATLSPPSILQTPLDCYTIFNAVAQRGGFEGVSGTRQWSAVAREWRADMSGMEAARVKKAYHKLLLAFEQHISQGTIVEVRKKKSTRLKRAVRSGSVEPEDPPVKKMKKRKAEGEPAAAPSVGKVEAEVQEATAVQEAEDSAAEGSEVSYGSDEPHESYQSDAESAESDQDGDKRLAAAAHGAKLKTLQKEAQRDSKFVKKKLQRQLESGSGSRGSKQKARVEASQEGDGEQALLRRNSSQGDIPTKGRRQVVDSRALAARPGQSEEQSVRAKQERRAQLRQQMQARTNNNTLEQMKSKTQPWRSSMDELLGPPADPPPYEEPKADARTLIVLQFRENYPLPSKAVVQNVMAQYGPLHVQDDIWFNKLKYLVYTRFKHEQDALTAYKMLDKKAAWLFNMAEGSVKRITLTVPYKDKKMGTANVASAAAPAPALAPSPALSDPSSYIPPSRPASHHLPNPGYPMAELPQPTDPRRAAAARAANPAPGGQYPGQIGASAGATSSGSGQYPSAAGLGLAGASGQSGRGLPGDPRADPRVDPRTDPRTKSAFRPAGGYAGSRATTSALYRPPPPPSQGGLPPPGGLPPFAGAHPSARNQWVPPMGGLPPPAYLAGLARPQGYPMQPPMPQLPLHQPSHPHTLPSSSSAPQHPYSSSANVHATTHTPTPESSIMRTNGLHRPAAAPAGNAVGPAVPDILSILRNAGLQNPLADLQANLAVASAPSLTAARHQPITHPVAMVRSSDAQVNGAQSFGDSAVSGSADVADAGPVLAGDDGGTGAPDVSNNLLALLSQLAPAGQ
ncbi:hypothetical protein WJX77_003445 [Trebouxia sp. C0004]